MREEGPSSTSAAFWSIQSFSNLTLQLSFLPHTSLRIFKSYFCLSSQYSISIRSSRIMVFTASTHLLALALAGSAAAGPLLHRQVSAPSPSAAQTTLASTVSPASLPNASALPSAVASVSSALGSAVSSAASNTSSAPAPTGTPVPSDPSAGFVYACPANYSLTYV